MNTVKLLNSQQTGRETVLWMEEQTFFHWYSVFCFP